MHLYSMKPKTLPPAIPKIYGLQAINTYLDVSYAMQRYDTGVILAPWTHREHYSSFELKFPLNRLSRFALFVF